MRENYLDCIHFSGRLQGFDFDIDSLVLKHDQYSKKDMMIPLDRPMYQHMSGYQKPQQHMILVSYNQKQ